MNTQPPEIDRDEYLAHLVKAWSLAHAIAEMPIELLLRQAERANTLGPFFDPTAWQRNHRKLEEDMQMLRSLLGVKNALLALRSKPTVGSREG